MRPDVMILVFWMLSFKPAFSLYSFTFIKSFSLLSAIRVVLSAYLRLLKFSWQSWFPLEIQELYRCLLCLLPWVLSNAWPLEAPVSSPLLLKVRGEGEDRGWDGWMALPTQWTWVWVISKSWWWTGRLGVLQSMGLQRVGHDWATELTDWLEAPAPGQRSPVTMLEISQDCCIVAAEMKAPPLLCFSLSWTLMNSGRQETNIA